MFLNRGQSFPACQSILLFHKVDLVNASSEHRNELHWLFQRLDISNRLLVPESEFDCTLEAKRMILCATGKICDHSYANFD